MKDTNVLKGLYCLFLFFAIHFSYSQNAKLVASCCDTKKVGRCTGSAYCTACTNCSGCKYCNSGGSCGVCASSAPSRSYSTTTYYTPSKSTAKKPKTKKVRPANNFYSGSNSNTNTSNHESYTEDYKPIKKGSFFMIKGTKLNLRSGPGITYDTIQELHKTDYGQILGSVIDGWVFVSITKSENFGYVKAENIEIIK
ncbi:hypothetical protein CLV94_2637 [Flavobacterium endophyticum]|uniref:SH3 domain-containing protein n=1 Tax=Flavobacterium endophyticum TaxID=1540163 RepID=A0A495M9S2_9FLAO|nr:SH3 domain-containing protein [Flavobacterium endophyticum]RKS22000.1 hypothetical protein CLV94_2637 [Flavobacterium endophyticum]